MNRACPLHFAGGINREDARDSGHKCAYCEMPLVHYNARGIAALRARGPVRNKRIHFCSSLCKSLWLQHQDEEELEPEIGDSISEGFALMKANEMQDDEP